MEQTAQTIKASAFIIGYGDGKATKQHYLHKTSKAAMALETYDHHNSGNHADKRYSAGWLKGWEG